MVNNLPLRLLNSLRAPTVLTDASRKIRGPVYDLDQVKLAIHRNGIFVINEDANDDAKNSFNAPLGDDEIKDMALALRNELYHRSEWVKTSSGNTLSCDSYLIKWNFNRRIEWEHGQKIYLKFGFPENIERCLIVSIHPALY